MTLPGFSFMHEFLHSSPTGQIGRTLRASNTSLISACPASTSAHADDKMENYLMKHIISKYKSWVSVLDEVSLASLSHVTKYMQCSVTSANSNNYVWKCSSVTQCLSAYWAYYIIRVNNYRALTADPSATNSVFINNKTQREVLLSTFYRGED